MNEVIKAFLSEDFHAIKFSHNGIKYCISGYWAITAYYSDGTEKDWGGPNKEDILKYKAFANETKTLEEVCDELEDVDIWTF